MPKITFKFFLEQIKKNEEFKKLSKLGLQRNKVSPNMEDMKNIKLPPASNDYWIFYGKKDILPLLVGLDLIEV